MKIEQHKCQSLTSGGGFGGGECGGEGAEENAEEKVENAEGKTEEKAQGCTPVHHKNKSAV